jgi:hypothetical protein
LECGLTSIFDPHYSRAYSDSTKLFFKITPAHPQDLFGDIMLMVGEAFPNRGILRPRDARRNFDSRIPPIF